MRSKEHEVRGNVYTVPVTVEVSVVTTPPACVERLPLGECVFC